MTYIFIDFENRYEKITADTLKEAIIMYSEGSRVGEDKLFRLAMEGCKSNDDCIEMYNRFYGTYSSEIAAIYQIKDIIYEQDTSVPF